MKNVKYNYFSFNICIIKMNIINVLLLLGMIILIYLLINIFGFETFNQINIYKKEKKYETINDPCEKDDLSEQCMINIIEKPKKKKKLNTYFQEMQFHTDYRDTLNAFSMMCDNKIIFNKSDSPLVDASHPKSKEVKHLIIKFIKETNNISQNEVSETINMNKNGWNDDMPLPQMKNKSGWDKFQESLGLPNTLYNEPASKAPIKLIKLDNIEKYETENEIKYVVYLIVQKKNVTDQMIVKVSFVIDRTDCNLDREFFAKNKNNYETKVLIEEIFVVGYLVITDNGNKKSYRENLYEFENISDGRMFNQEEIIKQLNKKRREYELECM